MTVKKTLRICAALIIEAKNVYKPNKTFYVQGNQENRHRCATLADIFPDPETGGLVMLNSYSVLDLGLISIGSLGPRASTKVESHVNFTESQKVSQPNCFAILNTEKLANTTN